MKSLAILALALLCPTGATSMKSHTPRAVTEVVRMLQDMLEKSKADGDADREIYAKLKCYCDTNERSKTEEIEAMTQEISLLDSQIQALQGSTGELSTECAKLQTDMEANVQARSTAQQQRDAEALAYSDTKLDLETAIGQMNQSIDILADVGADQTLEDAVAADHAKFMAGYRSASLLKLQTRVKEALTAANGFLAAKQKRAVQSFLQKPFTGTYTAQSGEVVGILKDMRDTFRTNLADATATENSAIEAFNNFMEAKRAAHQEMSTLYDDKQSLLGTNDDDLATKKSQRSEAMRQKGVREDFLAQMRPMFERKTAEYKERNTLRANEDAAISEAIAILDRDSSFDLFGKVNATSIGGTGVTSVGPVLVQLQEIQRHSVAGSPRLAALRLLQAAGRSSRLVKIAALLEADNPFTVVLTEIDNMIALIAEEGTNDLNQKNWCESERTRSETTVRETGNQINTLTNDISTLTNQIEEPGTGLKAQIESTEQGLQDNLQNQKSETALRTTDNLEYQENIDNLVKAEALLTSAINILTRYYDQIDDHAVAVEEEVATLPGETSARPSTWESERGYKGQSQTGANVISMLQFILDESKREETLAHQNEESSQKDYEDSMASLKSGEARMQSSLATLQQNLATAEQELLDKRDDLRRTSAEKAAAEAYLLEIKPGCDFIANNFDLRERNRLDETTALGRAKTLLKGSPAYTAAVAAADVEALGSCREDCEASRDHVRCKACLAGVTVPGYCAGHAGTPGC